MRDKNKFLLSIIAFVFFANAVAQTNTFPSTGSAGIGTTSPGFPLHILNNNNTQSIQLESNSAGWGSGMTFKNTAANGKHYGIYAGAYGSFQISDNNAGVNRFLIGNNGNIGIGTDNPSDKLHVTGTIKGDITNAPAFVSNSPLGVSIQQGNIGGDYNGANSYLSIFAHNMHFNGTQWIRRNQYSNAWATVLNSEYYDILYGTGTWGGTPNDPISTQSYFRIGTSGNVGIGTTDPTAKLQVAGSAKFLTGAHQLYISQSYDYDAAHAGMRSNEGNFVINSKANGTLYLNRDIVGDTRIQSNSEDIAIFKSSGQVGIGTLNVNDVNYKLFVEKGIRTRKVRVDQAGWPDYVFEKNYHLPSLKEVEEFIQQHKHLPDVPSAKEVEKNGLDLGDNQAILLKKIEELTLYVISLQKELEQVKSDVYNKK